MKAIKCYFELLASPCSSSSSDSKPVALENYQLGRLSGFTRAFVFARLDFEYEGAEWPPAVQEKKHNRKLPENCCTEKQVQKLRPVWRRLISIYFVLMNYSGVFFIVAVTSARFFSRLSFLPCIAKCKQIYWRHCVWQMSVGRRQRVRNNPSAFFYVQEQQEKSNLFLLAFSLTNTNI